MNVPTTSLDHLLSASEPPDHEAIFCALDAYLERLAAKHVTPQDGEWPGASRAMAVKSLQRRYALRCLDDEACEIMRPHFDMRADALEGRTEAAEMAAAQMVRAAMESASIYAPDYEGFM